MCTVTYVPIKKEYYLTSNRDESALRGEVEWPSLKKSSAYNLLYPRDKAGNGTWIAADDQNRVVCLLNGAFQRHVRKDHYRFSRGRVVLEIFTYSKIGDFYESYDLTDIEPFTLVIVWYGKLFEFKWDGNKKFMKNLDPNLPHIWSSVTLYNPEMIRLREQWFRHWLEKPGIINRDKILSFHQSEISDDPAINIKMKRQNVQTLSVTSLFSTQEQMSAVYFDLINKEISENGLVNETVLKNVRS